MKIYLFPNLSKKNCDEYTVKACEILAKSGNKLSMSGEYTGVFSKSLPFLSFGEEDKLISECDIIVAVGGDGTILKCARKSSAFGKPILGINCGRLGFMASLEHSQLELLEKLFKKEYNVSRRMTLKAKVFSGDGEVNELFALNDIVVSKSDDCKIADFEVSKSGHIISSLRADGVIISTATGSTAYSMSAGGVIVEPEMECMELTQICPHSLFSRSMILSADSVVTIKCHTNNMSHAHVYYDGNKSFKITNGDMITVEKSENYVDIIDISGGSFFTSVNNKLMQPLKDPSKEP